MRFCKDQVWLILLIFISTLSPHARADTTHWQAPASGAWGNAQNWWDPDSPDDEKEVPGSGVFDVAGIYTVSLSGAPANVSASVIAGNVSFSSAGGSALTLGVTPDEGHTSASVSLVDGALSGTLASVSTEAGETAELIFAGGPYNYDSLVVVPAGGFANVVIQSDVRLNTASTSPPFDLIGGVGGMATVTLEESAEWMTEGTVESAGSSLISVGTDARFSAGTARIASYFLPQTSTIEIAGGGARADIDEALVGFVGGKGEILVREGGTANIGYLSLAHVAGLAGAPGISTEGYVLVDGPESTLNISGQASIGNAGVGTLELRNGGTANFNGAEDVILGTYGPGSMPPAEPAAEGRIILDGAESQINATGKLVLGQFGKGTIIARNGASVDFPSADAGLEPDTTGSLVAEGEDTYIRVNGPLVLGYSEAGEPVGTGSLATSDSGAVAAVDLNMGEGATATTPFLLVGLENDTPPVAPEPGIAVNHLNMRDGATVTVGQDITMGDGEGVFGLVDAQGVGTAIKADRLGMGFGGDASIDLADGAALEAREILVGNDASGATLIADIEAVGADTSVSASEVFQVGVEGVGSATFGDSAELTAENTFVGAFEGGDGTLEFKDGATFESGGQLHVGFGGDGELNASSGSVVDAVEFVLGEEATGRGFVLFSGSGTEVEAIEMNVGRNGFGRVDVTGQAELSSTVVTIGENAGSEGEVVVSGNDTSWYNSGTVVVGEAGAALLAADSGGFVFVGKLQVGPLGEVIASSATVADASRQRRDARDNHTSGTIQTTSLSLAEGAVLNVDTLNIEPGGEISGAGALPGFENNGTLSPAGDDIGSMTIGGDFSQGGLGVLRVTVGEGGADTLKVNGAATLDGTLELVFAEGADLSQGLEVDIVQATAIDGDFSSIVAPGGSAPEYELSTAGGSLRLTVGEGGGGTHETDAYLTISRLDGGTAEITVHETRDGASYQIQATEDLQGTWVDIGAPLDGGEAQPSLEVPVDRPARYFRAEVVE